MAEILFPWHVYGEENPLKPGHSKLHKQAVDLIPKSAARSIGLCASRVDLQHYVTCHTFVLQTRAHILDPW